RAGPHRISSGKSEAAVTDARQQADASVTISHCQIRYAVAVEVNHRHVVRIRAGWEANCVLESAVSIAQKFADRPEAIVGHDDIGLAIAIEVANLNVKRTGDGISPGESKCAVAIIQEDLDDIVTEVWNG